MMIALHNKPLWLIISALSLLQCHTTNAWIIGGGMTRQKKNNYNSFALQYTKDDNNNENDNKDEKKREEEAEARRMEAVRSLQLAFYKSDAQKDNNAGENDDQGMPSTLAMTRLEASSGKLHHLPLWRAPWWEVPGRSNVLNVHDPIYTNMFEQIIRKPKPWCFGHLYLEGGSSNLKAGSLPTFETYAKDKCHKSAVMGCLMHIQDYRRFSNGRLLLLVHSMERFVVTDIEQELPYSIVDAQILPDPEELDPIFMDVQDDDLPENQQLLWKLSEQDLALARGMAVQESVRYHDYEYDPEQSLDGISNKTYLEPTDILWSSIARLLPFCPFAKTIPPPTEYEVKATLQQHFGKQGNTGNSTTISSTAAEQEQDKQLSLESQLFQEGILKPPLFDPEYAKSYQDMDADQLEYELWLAMNRYLTASKIPISPIVLGLLPRRNVQVNNNSTTTDESDEMTNVEDWPPDFYIYSIVRDLEATQVMPTNSTTTAPPPKTLGHQRARHDFVRVHPHYPKHRRQKRLSYSALSLLEKTSDIAKQLRPEFLATPSTKQRLRLVLEKLNQWQEEFWGEFQ